MGMVRSNTSIADGIYRLVIDGNYQADAGQFYMLRAWDAYPLLSRPVSVHDRDDEKLSFLYRVVGAGTELLAKLKHGDELQLTGPFGRGFPAWSGGKKLALVGGGIGIAPLLLAARQNPGSDVFLGFSDEPFGVDRFETVPSDVTIRVGGTIADDVDPNAYDAIFACGPLPLMERLAQKCNGTSAKLYISIEKRMACGVGACCGCSVHVNGENQKACTEGPVFEARGVDMHGLLDL